MRVAVVGAGIAGLVAALDLAEGGAQVTVLDAADRPGGKIHTTTFAGRRVDRGPDAFLARVPAGIDLARRLGLEGELVSPATGAAWLWSRGRLRPLPEGLVLGVPADLPKLVASGLLSPAGVLRAGLDLVLPRTPMGDDMAVGELVARRFGAEVDERLVDPLLGGINAGRSDRLSVEASAPQLAAVARSNRSLLLGLRGQRRTNPPAPSAPVFHGLAGGMGRLVDALVTRLDEAGVELRLSTPVGPLAAGGRAEVVVEGDTFDGAVLATPAFVAAHQLSAVAPAASTGLAGIEFASVALLLLAYRRDALAAPLAGSGFLVPRVEGRLVTACSWSSSKWAHLSGGDSVVLRASAGRIGDERAMALSDDELVARVHDELAQAMGLRAAPVDHEVVRWARAFPQYEPGHLARITAIEDELARVAPRVALAGAALRGVGIPACISSGRAAAAALPERIRQLT